MVIDCHFHLEERLLSRRDLLAQMDVAGIDKTVLMAAMVDPFPEPSPVLLKLMRFLLTHRFLRPLARMTTTRFTETGAVKMPSGVFDIYPDPDNTPVFEAVEAHPDRFLGWIFVNPRGRHDPVSELKRWWNNDNAVGVKAHPHWHRYPPVELVPVASEAARMGMPLLIHAGFGEHGDFIPLLDEVPGLKLILAHAAFPGYADTWPLITARENVFVDLSQTSYVDEKLTLAAVEFLGPERCFFGTDGPFGSHNKSGDFDMCLLKNRIKALFPDKITQQQLLGEGFAACAGLM